MSVRCYRALGVIAFTLLLPGKVSGGPPYASDDPEPTPPGTFEIYLFGEGEHAPSSSNGVMGIDLNYGAGPDLQLSAVLPIGFAFPDRQFGLANVEVAAKYRFMGNAASGGWDAALFPQIFIPSGSHRLGDSHASLFLPIWFERDWGPWSGFGGGGCTLHRGSNSRTGCQASWAITRQVTSRLQLGGELAVTSADAKGGTTEKRFGLGVRYDMDSTYHVLASAGDAVGANPATGDYSWYVALLSTF